MVLPEYFLILVVVILNSKTTKDTKSSLTLSLLPATLASAKKSTTLEQGKSGENPALSRNGNS